MGRVPPTTLHENDGVPLVAASEPLNAVPTRAVRMADVVITGRGEASPYDSIPTPPPVMSRCPALIARSATPLVNDVRDTLVPSEIWYPSSEPAGSNPPVRVATQATWPATTTLSGCALGDTSQRCPPEVDRSARR